MKHSLRALVLVTMLGAGVATAAADEFQAIRLAGRASLGYNAYPQSGLAFIDFIMALLGIRGECGMDCQFRLTKDFALGAEVGVACMRSEINGAYVLLYDIPMRLKASYTLGAVELDFFTGIMVANMYLSYLYYDLGLRFYIKSVFAEASYEVGLGRENPSYPRFSLGYRYSLLK